MRSLCLAAAFVALIATVDLAHAGERASGPACAPTDAYAAELRNWMLERAVGMDSLSVMTRNQIGIPVLSDTAIYFVSDSALCARAARAHAAILGEDTLNPIQVYLLQVGSTRWAAFNGSSAGEWSRYYFFDTAFMHVVGYAM